METRKPLIDHRNKTKHKKKIHMNSKNNTLHVSQKSAVQSKYAINIKCCWNKYEKRNLQTNEYYRTVCIYLISELPF